MYRIIATTDKKFEGAEFELTASPVVINEELTFYYEKKLIAGKDLVLSNSNYVIFSQLVEESQ